MNRIKANFNVSTNNKLHHLLPVIAVIIMSQIKFLFKVSSCFVPFLSNIRLGEGTIYIA